jgi:hypothetical protein
VIISGFSSHGYPTPCADVKGHGCRDAFAGSSGSCRWINNEIANGGGARDVIVATPTPPCADEKNEKTDAVRHFWIF